MLNKRKLKRLKDIPWFEESCLTRYDIADQKKEKLLEMARNGKPKPHWKNLLGKSLFFTYTNPNSNCYDPVFDKKIRELRPDWFITQFDITNQKKQQLLEIARNGEPRPHPTKHQLGSVFINYTNPKRKTYDPVFDKEIKELRPDWFYKASNKKQKLFEMAKNGEPRPNRKNQTLDDHPLAISLSSYTNSNQAAYDPIFDKEIRKLAPHWFKNARQKKTQAA